MKKPYKTEPSLKKFPATTYLFAINHPTPSLWFSKRENVGRECFSKNLSV